MSAKESIIRKHINIGFMLIIAWTILFFLLQWSFAEKASLFLNNGQNIVAKIVDKERCQNRGTIGYVFLLKGKNYQNISEHCVSSCKEANPGTVKIRYIQNDPSVNECGSVEDLFNTVQGFSLASFLSSFFFSWIIVCCVLALGVWIHCLIRLEDFQKSK